MYRKYVKPLLDFVISLILIIVLSPLMLFVAIITFIDLGLPLYNLKRMREGRGAKSFVMYKFRTKVLDEDKTTNSNRYTKVSRFIDRTRLNELPQLFNVLKGDMSLVGPRPFIPGEMNKNLINKKRYKVKPGLTGLAQINGGRAIAFDDKLEYDEIYYDKLSFLLDAKIVLTTIIKITTCSIDKL